jgi:hypothetical protein
MPMSTIIWGMRWRGLLPGLVLFKLVASSLQVGVVGAISGMGCVVPQPLAVSGNQISRP